MRRNRHLCLATLLVCAISIGAPAAVADPAPAPAAPAGWAADWWLGAAGWLVERLPFVAGVMAASSDGDESVEEVGDFGPPVGDGSDMDLTSLEEETGGESESGPHWDPNG